MMQLMIQLKLIRCRLQRWSFFHNDGMVMNFFGGTIAINGFSMVLLPLNHHHWMFFHWLTIDINGFSMVFTKVWHNGQQWFWPVRKTWKKHVIATFWIFSQTNLMIEKGEKWISQIMSKFLCHFEDFRQNQNCLDF